MAIRILHEVFRTRFEGEKLPSEGAVRHTRRVGELLFRERIYDPRPGRSIFLATLTGADRETYIIPALDRARVRKIDRGILISGLEVIPRSRGSKNIKSDDYPQTWFCRPVPVVESAIEGDGGIIGYADPAESRRQARELGETLEARRIAETLARRPARKTQPDTSTGPRQDLGYF